MKANLKRVVMALLITSLMSVSVFAKAKKETVKFPTDIKVNGTLINKGVYDVKFDYQTGELSIEQYNKVIARATASVEKRKKKARDLELRSSLNGAEKQMTGVTFAGADHNIIISSTQASR